jgi:hypothetical protein
MKAQGADNQLTLFSTAILFLGAFSIIMLRSKLTLTDGDTYWHLAVGEQIVRTRSLPLVDEYSYTRAGAPWIAKEWLSQVLFYWSYAWAGWIGVALMTATVAASAYSFLFAWLCRRVAPIVALTMTVVTMSLSMGGVLARPQIFFYLLLTLCACGLVAAVENKRTPWWLVPLVALWANLHASFPIALVLVGLFGLEAVVSASPEERTQTATKWALVLLASLAATGATPYGYGSLLVSVKLVGSNDIDAIDEWRPIGFDSLGIYGVAFIAGSLAIVAAARAGWTRAAPLLVCGALMAQHVRFFTVFAFVAAAALATPIATRFPRFARRLSPPSAAARRNAGAALALSCVAAVGIVMFAPKPRPAAMMTPSGAFAAARELHLSGPVFNDYPFGPFLIFNGVKTFIDSRAELFLGGLFERTRAAEWGEDATFLSLLDQYHVAWALTGRDSPATAKLKRAEGWKEMYRDDIAVIFVRTDTLSRN